MVLSPKLSTYSCRSSRPSFPFLLPPTIPSLFLLSSPPPHPCSYLGRGRVQAIGNYDGSLVGARQAIHRKKKSISGGRKLLGIDGEINEKEKEAMAVLAEARPSGNDDAVEGTAAVDQIFDAAGKTKAEKKPSLKGKKGAKAVRSKRDRGEITKIDNGNTTKRDE